MSPIQSSYANSGSPPFDLAVVDEDRRFDIIQTGPGHTQKLSQLILGCQEVDGLQRQPCLVSLRQLFVVADPQIEEPL